MRQFTPADLVTLPRCTAGSGHALGSQILAAAKRVKLNAVLTESCTEIRTCLGTLTTAMNTGRRPHQRRPGRRAHCRQPDRQLGRFYCVLYGWSRLRIPRRRRRPMEEAFPMASASSGSRTTSGRKRSSDHPHRRSQLAGHRLRRRGGHPQDAPAAHSNTGSPWHHEHRGQPAQQDGPRRPRGSHGGDSQLRRPGDGIRGKKDAKTLEVCALLQPIAEFESRGTHPSGSGRPSGSSGGCPRRSRPGPCSPRLRRQRRWLPFGVWLERDRRRLIRSLQRNDRREHHHRGMQVEDEDLFVTEEKLAADPFSPPKSSASSSPTRSSSLPRRSPTCARRSSRCYGHPVFREMLRRSS
jgi:hypothetical protein